MFPSRAIGITFILALTSLCVLAQTSPQPAASPEPSGTPSAGSITGQVVDENGQPLKGVTVQIRADGSNEAQTVGTDREGQFQVNGLAPFAYTIYLTMPAYFTDYGRGPGRYHIGDRVSLKMVKGGVVTGRVIDANGDPVVMVNVHAKMVRDAYGRPLEGWDEARATDDRGIYRIYGLREGTYVVYAGGPGRLRGFYTDSVFEFDVPTYAPSSTRETASEITVRMGEEVADVDIRYRSEQGRVISGDVTVPAKSHRSFSVRFVTDGEPGQFAETLYRSEDKASFVFKGVADGSYTLIAQSYDPEGEVAVSELKAVTVEGTDVTGIKLTTKLLGSVSGRVALDETKVAQCTDKENPLSTETSVFAWYRDDDAAEQIPKFVRPKEPARPDEKGNFLLRNLPPGAYYFDPSLRARPWYVNSITFGAPATDATTKSKQVDATRVWTNVKASERLSGLTITLAQGGATLRGQYDLAPGEPVPAGSFLYLAPAEREKATDVLRFFATPIARNGVFELYNIAPGRYWVLVQMGDGSVATSTKVRWPHETGLRAQIRREAEAAKIELEFKPCQNVVDYHLSLKPASQ
ncbi:MAG TPA: carboxypeptidase-like regulatory domain-containing protein [Pyrinomonadaceae bacterium]|nr:carboxypeptidase-like regulatory domain-containing protein [Pyrinomonadaceae bacterium]